MAIIGNPITLITLKAVINVTTKAGATVTFKKGSTTMGTKTATATTAGQGVASLEVLSGDWGAYSISVSWTQSGISTAATGSASVTVSAATTYNVTANLTWYLIKDGNFCTGFATSVVGPTRAVFEDSGDYIRLTMDTYEQPANDFASGYFTQGIDMAYWNSMTIDTQEKGQQAWAGLTTDTSAQEASFTNSVQLLPGQQSYYDTRSTSTLSLSGVTGTKYVALRTKGWVYIDSGGIQGSAGIIRVWNLYLQG